MSNTTSAEVSVYAEIYISQWNSTESISITVITCTPQLHSLAKVHKLLQLQPVGLAHCVSLLGPLCFTTSNGNCSLYVTVISILLSTSIASPLYAHRSIFVGASSFAVESYFQLLEKMQLLCLTLFLLVTPLVIGANLSESYTGSNCFNHGTSVTFLKVYATNTESVGFLKVYTTNTESVAFLKVYTTNTESPSLLVVYSTIV